MSSFNSLITCCRAVCVRQNCWRRDITQTATTVSRFCRSGKWLDLRQHANGSERMKAQPPWVIVGGQRWGGTVCRASSGVRWMFTFWKEERISVKCLLIKYNVCRGTLTGSQENKALSHDLVIIHPTLQESSPSVVFAFLILNYFLKVLQTICHILMSWPLWNVCWMPQIPLRTHYVQITRPVQMSLLMYLLFTSWFKHLCLRVQAC